MSRLIPLWHLRVHVGRTALSHLQYRMGSQAWVRGGGIGYHLGVQVQCFIIIHQEVQLEDGEMVYTLRCVKHLIA